MPIAERSTADRRGDEANEQRDEHDDVLLGPRVHRERLAGLTTASRNTIVRPARRMLSAISFGVFWRSLVSTSAIIRSRKLWPASGRHADGDLVREHARAAGHGRAVATRLADHRRRLTGDRRLVHARDPLRSTSPSRGNHLAGRDHDLVADAEETELGTSSREPSGRRRCAFVSARICRRVVRLRLAPALGHRFGEIREEHREPEPGRDDPMQNALGSTTRAGPSRARSRSPPRTGPGLPDDPPRVELDSRCRGTARSENRRDRRASEARSATSQRSGAPAPVRARASGST